MSLSRFWGSQKGEKLNIFQQKSNDFLQNVMFLF